MTKNTQTKRASASQNCACSSTFVDPRCERHGAHEYHGKPVVAKRPPDREIAHAQQTISNKAEKTAIRQLPDQKTPDYTREECETLANMVKGQESKQAVQDLDREKLTVAEHEMGKGKPELPPYEPFWDDPNYAAVSVSRIFEEAIDKVINLRGCSRLVAWTYLEGEIRDRQNAYYAKIRDIA